MKSIIVFVLSASTFIGFSQEDESSKVVVDPATALAGSIAELDTMLADLTSLKDEIIRNDLGRLLVLEREVKKVRDSVVNLPTGHFDIFRSYQDMIRTFIYSEDWFKKDFPDAARPYLVKLEETIAQLRVSRGFDESPFGMVVYDILKQLHLKFNDLLDRDIDSDFKAKIAEVISTIAEAMPIAKRGDRPLAFEEADKVYAKVKDLYPYFDEVATSDSLFETYISIQGINEYYSDAAQHVRRQLEEKK